jgi:hypothetical protein
VNGAKKMLIPACGHPLGAIEMAFPGKACPRWFSHRVNLQDDARHLLSVGSVGFGIEEADIGDQMRSVVAREGVGSRGLVSDLTIGWKLGHITLQYKEWNSSVQKGHKGGRRAAFRGRQRTV